ncbi:MAG: tyrosine-type recombinase/integrase [Anaerolineales bacterium]
MIADRPEFEVPPRHHRRLTVRVDRLGGYRFSDYERLRTVLVDEVCGKGSAIVPPMLSTYPHGLLALALILCGVCTSGAISLLTELTWAEVPLHPNLPLRLPRRGRQGWVWLGLPPLARLYLLAAYFRAGKPSPEERVLAVNPKTLNRELRLLLAELCQVANLPVLLPSQLIHFVRLDVRQALPNLNLAILTGLVKYTPVAADQVLDVLHEWGVTPDEWTDNLPGWLCPAGPLSSGDEELPAETETELEEAASPDDDEALLAAYDQLLDEIRPHVRALSQPNPSKRSKDFLEKWVRSAPPVEQAQSDVAHFNLAWLVRWLLNLTRDRRLKPGSRAVYWSAILNLVRIAPACGLHELDQYALPDLMEQGYLMSQVTRAAWMRLGQFLRQAGLPMPRMERRHWKAPAAWEPARVLLEPQQKSLLAQLRGTPLGRACYLARQAGLRVSEVCRLQSKDVVLDGKPYLIIPRSKRGRNRRVSLEHLPPAHLEHQRRYQADRLRQGDTPYLADARGQPLDPKAISEGMSETLKDAGQHDDLLNNPGLRFHSWRAAAAENFYKQSGDVRHVAVQMGHALAATTIGSYLHTLDLQSVSLLPAWPSSLNRRDLHLPVVALAALLGRTSRRIVQMVREFNEAHPSWPVALVGPENLPDGPRPARPGRPADYLSVTNALRLVIPAVDKSSSSVAASATTRPAPSLD